MAAQQSLTRIAVVDKDKCKPKKCNQECKSACPVNRTGKLCIEVSPSIKSVEISEGLCIGCGICVKKCPFGAISIINIPSNLSKQTTHRYGPNSFKLHRLPTPRVGQVLGLVGANGTGKSTALKILAGIIKPNLGKYECPPGWKDIVSYFRGSELQGYFTKLIEDKITVAIKPQHVDILATELKGNVGEIISKMDERGVSEVLCEQLNISKLKGRNVDELSGGELQRLSIAITASRKANVYMFDEPSSYLDVKQRLICGNVIRGLTDSKTYVICVEHDLSILDYLSDFVCVLYGSPGVYGVVTTPFSTREGINIFLDGYIKTENLRFRETSLTFNISETSESTEDEIKHHFSYKYPSMEKTLGSFKLHIEGGEFTESEIIVMLGENGTGKTTFIRMLAGLLDSDQGETCPKLLISYKPQKITPKFPGTVRQLLQKKINNALIHPQFQTDVTKPLQLENILDQKVKNLSGGELQRVALTLCLGTPADIYLIDEPSAYLDSDYRIIAAKVIKRFIIHSKKTGFIVEHDFIMATYLADRVIVYDGIPSVECTARKPETLICGMNKFLKALDITFRRDSTNFRPRINKLNSIKDQEQKKGGEYFFQ